MMERPKWQRILYEIWPTIYRIINETVFFVLMMLRTIVKMSLRQIKRD